MELEFENVLQFDTIILLRHSSKSQRNVRTNQSRKLSLTSSFITVALLKLCKADVILRPKSAKTIANGFRLKP